MSNQTINTKKLQCGNPKHPDLIASPNIAHVIDRDLIIENEKYSQYLSYINEVNSDCDLNERMDTSICIFVDDIKGLEIPSMDLVLQVDIKQKNAVKWILHNLELVSKLNAVYSEKL